VHLVMLDIDGTLTQSNEVDAHCFIDAVKAVTNLKEIDSDWGSYRHVTDSGIASEIVERQLGRSITDEELLGIRRRFVESLRCAAKGDPQLFAPIPGAPRAVEALRGRRDVALALATGGWEEAARLKLATAGFPWPEIPMASSNDSDEREEIMILAHERARGAYQVNAFDTRTLIGDGIWDVRASRNLGYHFIGIASGEQAHRLRAEGARLILESYENLHELMKRLRCAWGGPRS